jgi:PAS domain S-box-containing protein
MRPVSLPGGGLMIMLQDVTDARRSEEMLRSTEAKFRTLVHENPHPVILTDRTGSVFDVNPAAETLLGYTRAELRRMSMERWLESASMAERAKALREMVHHADRCKSMPAVIINREGLTLPVTLRLATVPDVQGEPIFTVHFLIPVVLPSLPAPASVTPSEPEHAAESFLLEPEIDSPCAERIVRNELQHLKLIETDMHGRIQSWTPEATEHFGLEETVALGRGLHTLFRPSDATGFYSELAALPMGGEPAEVEWSYFHTGLGRQIAVFGIDRTEPGSLSITLSKPYLVEMIETPQSINHPAKIEPASPDSEQTAAPAPLPRPTVEELSREKLLLGETHHRVKNHLQIVTSMLNLQMSTLHNVEARDALRSSQNRVRSIAALHQHLYQLATGEVGTFKAFAEDLIGHLRECFEVNSERVQIHLHLPEKAVPEEWLMPLALSLNEMVSNAFKHAYAHERTGEMQIALHWDEAQGALIVSDDGYGLPESFDANHPSGMGLKILRVFAGQIGGEIKIASLPGEGAEFRLCFPVSLLQE